VVKPPNDGAEYSLLLAPKPGTKVTVPALPLGASTIRVVAVDAWYACGRAHVRLAKTFISTSDMVWQRFGPPRPSGDTASSAPVTVNVTSPAEISADQLSSMLASGVARYGATQVPAARRATRPPAGP